MGIQNCLKFIFNVEKVQQNFGDLEYADSVLWIEKAHLPKRRHQPNKYLMDSNIKDEYLAAAEKSKCL